jgi:hypothetical protein
MLNAQDFSASYLFSSGFTWSEKFQQWRLKRNGKVVTVLITSRGSAGGTILRCDGSANSVLYHRIDRV